MTGEAGGTGARGTAVLAGPAVRCTADGGGRIAVELASDGGPAPRLCLRLRGSEGAGARRFAEAARGAGGSWRVALPGDGRPLEEGRWDVYLLDGSGTGEPCRVRAGLNDLRALIGRRPAPGEPVAVRIPYRTGDGHLAVRAWLRPAHAEAGDLVVGEDAVTVRGELFGADLDGSPVAVARCRGRGGTVTVQAPVAAGPGPGSFAFALEYSALAGACPGAASVWDLAVRPSKGARAVRVARLLDDVADRKKVFRYPSRPVGGLLARPYYTVDNDLAIALAEPPPGEAAGVSGSARPS